MNDDLTRDELHDYAREGARQQLHAILRLFPELRADLTPEPPPQPAKVDRRKRRTLTPAHRRALRRGLRAYWARKHGKAA